MSADASDLLQRALYDKLIASPAMLNVYDDVPPSPTFPYVTLGETTTSDDGDKTRTGQEFTETLHVWSRAAGDTEAKQTLGVIYDALHEQELSVTGFTVVFIRFEFSEVFLDEDGKTRHGVCRYRIAVEPA